MCNFLLEVDSNGEIAALKDKLAEDFERFNQKCITKDAIIKEQGVELFNLREQLVACQKYEDRYRWLTRRAFIGRRYTDDGSFLVIQNLQCEVPIKGSVNEAIDAALAALNEGDLI